MKNMRENREFLKSGDWNIWSEKETDQRRKIPMPDKILGVDEIDEFTIYISPVGRVE